MRAFFAITPDADTCLHIQHWCQQNWPALERPVPVQNYHLTLAFLGDITTRQFDNIELWMQQQAAPEFSLSLDQLGYWPDSHVLWIGPSSAPAALQQLAKDCNQAAARNGIKVTKKRYQPHLTLARRVTQPPAAALIDASFDFVIDGFQLYESSRRAQGPLYSEVLGCYR